MMNTGRQPRTLLEAMTWERHWTHQDFCEEYARTARKLELAVSVTPQHVSRWMAGKLKGLPYPAQRRVLEHMFGVDATALFAPPTSDLARYGAIVPGEMFHSPEEVIAMAASESARFGQFAEQTNVGPHTLEQFEADLRRIVTTYPNRPVYPMFVELRELRNRAFELLEGRQRPDQSRDLYLVAGLLCGVLANASFDLGYLHAAETQSRTAFLCAELAGHNGLKAWIRGTQSLIAYWDDRPHAALDLAIDGWRYQPESGTAGVRIAAIEARARGRLRDTAGAQAALRRTEEARTAVAGPDEPGGMMAFPDAKQMFYAATTHLWIGGPEAHREAERSAEAAVRAYQEDPPERRRIGEMSLARLDLATARLVGQDLDGTAEQVQEVLEVGARRRIESVARRLGEVAIVLERPQYQNTGPALDLHDQITDYLRTVSVPALPPGNGQ
jgi:hypothetical protein